MVDCTKGAATLELAIRRKETTRTPGWHPEENEAQLPQKGTLLPSCVLYHREGPQRPHCVKLKGPKDPGVTHWQSRPALEPIRAESPSNGAADELVSIASTFWDFGSLSLKTRRRPLCQLLWQRQSVSSALKYEVKHLDHRSFRWETKAPGKSTTFRAAGVP